MLRGKAAAVFGFASHRSIAWQIATAFHNNGAQVAVGIQSERFRDRLQALAEDEWGSQPAAIIECDVGDDEELLRAGTEVADAFPSGLDILVHSIAFATAHGIQSPMIDCTREDFRVAHDISAYSLVGMTRSMLPALETSATASKSSSNQRGAPLVLALSYFGAERAVPHYGIMGPAKASLEATMRGLAAELGPRGIRVNCLSPGTVQTLAARGIPGFQDLHSAATAAAPGPHVPDAVDVGQVAAMLASEAGAGIHGQTIRIDGGLSSLAFPGLATSRA